MCMHGFKFVVASLTAWGQGYITAHSRSCAYEYHNSVHKYITDLRSQKRGYT